jgi:hypothetical protein
LREICPRKKRTPKSRNPVNDANVSTGTAARVLNVLQTSVRRDIGREKQHAEQNKKIIEDRQENSLNRIQAMGFRHARYSDFRYQKAGVKYLENGSSLKK